MTYVLQDYYSCLCDEPKPAFSLLPLALIAFASERVKSVQVLKPWREHANERHYQRVQFILSEVPIDDLRLVIVAKVWLMMYRVLSTKR